MLHAACRKDISVVATASLRFVFMFPIQLTVQVGYWKDLLEILARQAVGEEVFEAQREARIKHNERAPTRRTHKVGLDCC